MSIISATEPDQPLPPTRTSSTKNSISITWSAPNNGGTPITGYKILSKQVNQAGSFVDITSNGTLNVGQRTFTTAEDLTTGASYYFKVIASNAVSDGLESNQSVAMIAAIAPSAPTNFAK